MFYEPPTGASSIPLIIDWLQAPAARTRSLAGTAANSCPALYAAEAGWIEAVHRHMPKSARAHDKGSVNHVGY